MNDEIVKTNHAYDLLANEYALGWDDDSAMHSFLNRFVKLLPNNGYVLDLGCGTGRDVKWLTDKGIPAFGLDLSEGMLEQSKRKANPYRIVRSDIRNLPFENSTFEGIWCVGVIQHIPKKHTGMIVEEIARILRNHGIIFLSVLEGTNTYCDSVGRFSNEFTIDEIRDLFGKNNFRLLDWSVQTSNKSTCQSSKKKKWLNILAKNHDAFTPAAFEQKEYPVACSSFRLCPFCFDSKTSLYEQLSLTDKIQDIVLWRTENLLLLPDIAPMIEGHVLLTTVKHFACYGAVPTELDDEIVEAKAYIENLIHDKYGIWPLIFEHGSANPREAGGCIDHAHFHILPLSMDIKTNLERMFGSGYRTSLNELHGLHKYGYSYLLIERKDMGSYCFIADQIPSQLVRWIIAEKLGQTKMWRWVKWACFADARNVVKATIKDFSTKY